MVLRIFKIGLAGAIALSLCEIFFMEFFRTPIPAMKYLFLGLLFSAIGVLIYRCLRDTRSEQRGFLPFRAGLLLGINQASALAILHALFIGLFYLLEQSVLAEMKEQSAANLSGTQILLAWLFGFFIRNLFIGSVAAIIIAFILKSNSQKYYESARQ